MPLVNVANEMAMSRELLRLRAAGKRGFTKTRIFFGLIYFIGFANESEPTRPFSTPQTPLASLRFERIAEISFLLISDLENMDYLIYFIGFRRVGDRFAFVA